MLSRTIHRRALLSSRMPLSSPSSSSSSSLPSRTHIQRRTFVAAPKPGDGPLMERRPDRELPKIEGSRWGRTLPLFIAVIAVSSVAIFNYQKLSSPVVSSTLYALRTNAKAREYLGDEIYFRHSIPWISGQMNQLRGRIDIRFAVKGTRHTGMMRFASFRPSAKGVFETTEWSLETDDGRKIDLLDGEDPFRSIVSAPMDEDEKEEATRGFRQQLK